MPSQKEKIIGQGAEAIISLSEKEILKNRIRKSYRLPELDKKIRIRRTRSEAKLIQKVSELIPVPQIISSPISKSSRSLNNYILTMEYIPGKKLSEHLESLDYQLICEQIGRNIAILHDSGIIHGDLTTSNLILKNNDVYFIDFGLGFHSNKAEDKAVDLHLIKQALEAKHHSIYEKAFSAILQNYKKTSKHSVEVLKRLEKVEKRGRYKSQY